MVNKLFLPDTYSVHTEDMSSASAINVPLDLQGPGFFLLTTGNPQGVSIKVNHVNNESIPIKGNFVWPQYFNKIYLSYTSSKEARIYVITQLTGNEFRMIPELISNDFMREEYLTVLATNAKQYQQSEQLDVPSVSVMLRNIDPVEILDYGIETSLFDIMVQPMLDVVYPTQLAANASIIVRVDHAVRKVRVAYKRNGAADVPFDLAFMAHTSR